MALPVAVVLDRTAYQSGTLDLSPLVDADSLTWSSVVPGGFGSCSFMLKGDPRTLVKQLPYLSIVRVIGDSGAVLWEGQIEDLAPTISTDSAGVKVGAFGLQNILREVPIRSIWSKRDMAWGNPVTPTGSVIPGTGTTLNPNFSVQTGQFDPTDLTKSGVQVGANGGVSVPTANGMFADWLPPIGISIAVWIGGYTLSGTDSGSSKWVAEWWYQHGGTWTNALSSSTAGVQNFNTGTLTATPTIFRVGVANGSGAPVTLAANDLAQFYSMRFLGVISAEDAGGVFYGDTLIESLLGFVPGISPGILEPGTDFGIDHLDASTRRFAYDVLQEITGYYTREWAVWENGLLNWTTPNLGLPQWIIPISLLSSLELDASTQNSQQVAYVLYTDAASGITSEQSATSTDRRNPYVSNGRLKTQLNPQSFPMTSSTAAQLAAKLLQDVGYGPVPAAGSISLPGETLVSHAQSNSKKAWEIRAGDNVTIPELPLVDVFTQDGRGECLFHVISAEASSSGMVTLSLDSYGSKRSDVLLARLAAVTNALGG
jgi:hypothetical protein